MVHAASADKIVTQPGTATGSIGVACLDLNLAPAFKKAGINLESVSVGRYQSPGMPWFWLVKKTPDDVQWFNAFKDRSVHASQTHCLPCLLILMSHVLPYMCHVAITCGSS